MTDAIRSLFELLTKKEKSGSDYTGTVTRVEGKTAYVRFDGADIDDTPVALSIGAKEGDTVRIRVADGRAWLVGNDSAPPNDSADVKYELELTNAFIRELTTERITGENGWINLLLGTFNYGNGKLAWNGQTLSIDGKIASGDGEIGGWKITKTQIYKSVIANGYEYRAILNAPTSLDGSTKAIAIAVRTNDGAGNVGNWEYPLYMQYNGRIYTNNAIIDNGGRISLWSIQNGNMIYSNGAERAHLGLNTIYYKNGDKRTDLTYEGVKVSDDTTGAKAQAALDVSGLSIYANNAVTGKTTEYKYDKLYVWGNGTFRTGNVRTINQAGRKSGFFAESTYHGGLIVDLEIESSGNHGLYSNGYWNGTRFVSDEKWLLECDSDGRVKVPSYSGTRSYPIVSNSTIVGNRVGGLICNTATQLSIYGDWKATDGSAKYMYVTVGSSDPRLKHDIAPTEMDALELIDEIPLKAFTWNDSNKRWDVGFIAPELYEIDPNLAIRPDDEDEGYWGVDDFYLTGIQTKAIQELHARVKSLENEVAELKQMIVEMRKGSV